jgi:hypothetical protein
VKNSIVAAVGGFAIAIAFAANSFGQNETELGQKLAPQLGAMVHCYSVQNVRLSTLSCEPAEAVAEAAFGNCGAQEKAYMDELVKIGGPTDFGDRLIANVKAGFRQSLPGIVLSIRKARGLCLGNPN